MGNVIPQQVTFDTLARHLIRQGRPSVRRDAHGITGAYRGEGGCRCPAGLLIPDDLYDPGFEGLSVADDQPTGRIIAEQGHDLPLVQQLQLFHDGLLETWSPIGVTIGLRQLAESFGLSSAVLAEPV